MTDSLAKLLAARAETNHLPVEEALAVQSAARAAHGLRKYGVTCDRKDLTVLEWLQHFKEEHMDAIRYAEACQRTLEELGMTELTAQRTVPEPLKKHGDFIREQLGA